MSELNYKELQERGVFDVPYRAFEFMRTQQTKIDQLKSELALCREENKGLVGNLNRERARTAEALFQMRQKSLALSEDCDGYKDPVQICQSEGVDMGVKILEKALRGANDINLTG